jgi:hypothetical protein
LLAGDLDGLKLEQFDVSHNPIEHLGPDFFRGQDQMRAISFYSCHLKVIHPDALNPLVKLREASFELNRCIDARSIFDFSLSMLKKKIIKECRATDEDKEILKRVNETFTCPDLQEVSEVTTKSFVKRQIHSIMVVLTVVSVVLFALILYSVKFVKEN